MKNLKTQAKNIVVNTIRTMFFMYFLAHVIAEYNYTPCYVGHFAAFCNYRIILSQKI